MDAGIEAVSVQVAPKVSNIFQISDWDATVSSFQELDAEQCRTRLDSLRTSITSSCGTWQEDQGGAGQCGSCEALLAALIRLAKTWLAPPQTPATQDTIRTVTSALRCIIAILSHGPSLLLQRDVKRVHELSSLCLSIFQWLLPAGPGLRAQASTSSLSQLRRPASHTSNTLQNTGVLAFGGSSVRQSRPLDANPLQRGGSYSRSSSASSWRSVKGTALPPIPSLSSSSSDVDDRPEWPRKTPSRALESDRAHRSRSDVSASELDSEESATESRTETRKATPSGDASRACKYYCISCLSHINTKNARAFFLDWPMLFGQSKGGFAQIPVPNVLDMTRSDQALSVRTAAVQLCESALERAGREGLLIVIDDRPQRSSAFISLAARTGAVVSDIRLCIATILTAASATSTPTTEGSSNLTLAALKAAKAVVTSTPNVAYRQRSAVILTAPVVSLCSSLDSATATSAFSVLSELMSASVGNNVTMPAMPLDNILSQLSQSEPHLGPRRTQAWKALSSVVEQAGQDTNPYRGQILELCGQTLKQSPSDLERQAAISILPLLLRKLHQGTISADQTEHFHIVTGLGVKDTSPLVRCSAADCLLPLAAISGTATRRTAAHVLLETLLSDSEGAVSAAAARAIGVCFDSGYAAAALKANEFADTDSDIVTFAAFMAGSRLLRTGRHKDEDARKRPDYGPLHARATIVRVRASWSFATMCDKSADQVARVPASATHPLVHELLCLAISLSKDDDRIATNALRALGGLLRMSPRLDENHQDLRHSQDAALAALTRHLQTAKDPKLRWNAGAALERAFANLGLLELMCESTTASTTMQMVFDGIVGAACGDKMFKVKLASLQALVRIHLSAQQSGGRTNEHINALLEGQGPKLRAAKEDLQEKAETAPFRERQLHVDPCRKALQTLLSAYKDDFQVDL